MTDRRADTSGLRDLDEIGMAILLAYLAVLD
jgi:hypothetical protein